MDFIRTQNNKKFIAVEITFFVIYFLLFDIITGLEYKFYESRNTLQFLHDIPGQLTYGFFNMVQSWICYKILIQGTLFKKKYLQFFIFLFAYLALLNFYKLYSYRLIAAFNFLPEDTRTQANRWYHSNVIMHFSIIYVFRELLVITALAYFIRSALQEKQMNELKQQQLQAELKYLKVQLQPHFFFNTLNNIYALTLQRSSNAAPLIAKHAEMMRYILYDSSSQVVELQKEISFLKNYTDVEALRYPQKKSIVFDTQGINNSVLIEPLLLLPYIENTFKHGIGENTNEGYVHIVICLVDNELILETRNSKTLKNKNENQKGIGLENAAKRLALLYPGKNKLDVTENCTEYELRLTLELKSNDEMHNR